MSDNCIGGIIELVNGGVLEIDYLADLQKHKKVRQNLFYMTGGAASFYTYRDADFHEIRWADEVAFFKRQPFWTKDKRVAFVSLGCGNAGAEKMLLRTLHAEGYHVAYLGVDSSRAMLELAQANLAGETFARTFLLADFSRADFVTALRAFLADFDTCIYAMIGGTFGNFEQGEIAAMLANIIPAGDYLYLDVVPQFPSDEENCRLRERLIHLPQNLSGFFMRLLEKLSIDPASGELSAEEICEDDVGAFRYTACFRPHETIDFPAFDGTVHLDSGECLELLNVRAYDPASLQTFLAGWGFAFLEAYIPDVGTMAHLWERFLFRRM
jgi:uncharacterized SAM-dependent methyltransferase